MQFTIACHGNDPLGLCEKLEAVRQRAMAASSCDAFLIAAKLG
jgi:hypothetical protein